MGTMNATPMRVAGVARLLPSFAISRMRAASWSVARTGVAGEVFVLRHVPRRIVLHVPTMSPGGSLVFVASTQPHYPPAGIPRLQRILAAGNLSIAALKWLDILAPCVEFAARIDRMAN